MVLNTHTHTHTHGKMKPISPPGIRVVPWLALKRKCSGNDSVWFSKWGLNRFCSFHIHVLVVLPWDGHAWKPICLFEEWEIIWRRREVPEPIASIKGQTCKWGHRACSISANSAAEGSHMSANVHRKYSELWKTIINCFNLNFKTVFYIARDMAKILWDASKAIVEIFITFSFLYETNEITT